MASSKLPIVCAAVRKPWQVPWHSPAQVPLDPHPAPQPLHQRQIVGEAAEQRLAQVNVRLDQAGEDVAAAGVDDTVVRLVDVRRDARDAAAPNRDVAVDDLVPIVQRDDSAFADEEGHLRRSAGLSAPRWRP